jgi:hypothetical protein
MSDRVKTSSRSAEDDCQADGKAGVMAAVSTASKTNGSWSAELDGLFAEKKTKKRQQDAEAAAKQRQQTNFSKKHKRGDEKPTHDSYGGKKKGAEEWVDDGLGGVYNREGYTGRVEDGVRVFKAHVLRKPNSGQTPLCPFDCDCCFI